MRHPSQDPVVPTGEWLLTKQVNEVNVLFMAARNGKPVADLSRNDIVVRDDGKAPKAILGFRNEQKLPLRVGVVIDTSSSVTSRFRFEQSAASAFFHQAMNRDSDLGFVMGFENHPTVTQDFVADPDLLSQGCGAADPWEGEPHSTMRSVPRCQKLLHRPEQDMVARVLVVLSDGQNNAGEVSLERAIDAAQEAEVTIYAISTNYSTASAGTKISPQVRETRISASWQSRPAVECSIRPIQRQWQKPLQKSARSCAAGTLFPTSRQISPLTAAFEESTLKLEKLEKSWRFMREKDIVPGSRPRSVTISPGQTGTKSFPCDSLRSKYCGSNFLVLYKPDWYKPDISVVQFSVVAPGGPL